MYKCNNQILIILHVLLCREELVTPRTAFGPQKSSTSKTLSQRDWEPCVACVEGCRHVEWSRGRLSIGTTGINENEGLSCEIEIRRKYRCICTYFTIHNSQCVMRLCLRRSTPVSSVCQLWLKGIEINIKVIVGTIERSSLVISPWRLDGHWFWMES